MLPQGERVIWHDPRLIQHLICSESIEPSPLAKNEIWQLSGRHVDFEEEPVEHADTGKVEVEHHFCEVAHVTHLEGEFFAHLAHQRLFGGFAGLDGAAEKAPVTGVEDALDIVAPLHEIATVIEHDQGRDGVSGRKRNSKAKVGFYHAEKVPSLRRKTAEICSGLASTLGIAIALIFGSNPQPGHLVIKVGVFRMGISRAAVHYMMVEGKKVPFSGRCLTFGVQQTTVSEKDLKKLSEKVGYPLKVVDETGMEKLDRHQHLTDLFVLKSLGFEDVVRADFSDFQGAELVFDLNQEETPTAHIGKYDFVIDGGTIEHVFHLPNSLNHIFRFLKVGGRVFHLSPSSNNIDHGFYMFSPTLFWDYYEANKFEFSSFKFIEYNRWGNAQKWIAGNYEPGSLRYVSGGGLPRGHYGLVLIATKTEASTSGVVPQQHRYAKTWKRKTKRKKSRSMTVYRLKKRAEQFWKRYRRFRFPLPVSERF